MNSYCTNHRKYGLIGTGTNGALCEASERFKSSLRKCLNHGFDEHTQILNFYNGLHQQSKLLLDAIVGDSLKTKVFEEAVEIIEVIATSDQ
ncbi:hypothetical protein Lal_00020920 [Lupinus albus]|nr:hypothetical protein Lal_00020920 [Lupinus albus]